MVINIVQIGIIMMMRSAGHRLIFKYAVVAYIVESLWHWCGCDGEIGPVIDSFCLRGGYIAYIVEIDGF